MEKPFEAAKKGNWGKALANLGILILAGLVLMVAFYGIVQPQGKKWGKKADEKIQSAISKAKGDSATPAAASPGEPYGGWS